jgi:hypothetical protein
LPPLQSTTFIRAKKSVSRISLFNAHHMQCRPGLANLL